MDRSWTLEGFPDRVPGTLGDFPDEVQKAYSAWLENCKVNPKKYGARLQGDDIRYTAEIPNGCYADEHGGWQLMCDYDVHEATLLKQGRAVFVEIGFAEGDDLKD